MAGMTQGAWWAEAWVQAMNRRAARRAARTAPATGFVSPPEPRTIGLYARGKQLVAGNFLFAGHLIEAPATEIWDIACPSPAFEAELQGFAWLDDLAAVGDAAAKKRAQDWTFGWIDRFGRGQGPGWTPDLTGRRLIRWINHAILLQARPQQAGQDHDRTQTYYHSLSQQTAFLADRWQAAAPGLPRFEALTGLIYAGLALVGKEGHVGPAALALGRECAREVDEAGGIPTRNPEELLEVFTLLTWAAQALTDAGHAVPPPHLAAIERIAPTLRALRHADGGLARFHGGGRGLEGRLDHALASSGVKAVSRSGPAMGFARLSGGRTSLVVDVAEPPTGRAGAAGHASTLAFELTSGRRPLIAGCGAGAPFGADWQRASRATQSHSTLTIDGYSSSRFAHDGREVLEDLAHVTLLQQSETAGGHHLLAGHDGWRGTHGLVHLRDLTLSHDGRHLAGVDMLAAETTTDRARLAAVQRRDGPVGFALRFHLHPDADAALDMGGTAVSVALRSGELWVFRHDGQAKLTLEPSVYLEKGRLLPRAAKQIVLGADLRESDLRIGWTLAKAQDTPLAIRDLDRDDPLSRP